MDIIIFGGQSNMQGESESCTPGVVAHAYEYRFLDDTIIPLENPVGEDILRDGTRGRAYMSSKDATWGDEHVFGSACFGNTSLIPKFCEAYIAVTGAEVLAVPVAKGSTFIETWLPGGYGHEILVQKAQAAINKAKNLGHKVEHIFFVWLQGECDAIIRNTKEYYKEKVADLNEVLKDKLQIEKFGVIRVGRFTNDERDLEIIDAQDEICEEHKDFLMLTTIATELNAKPEYMNPNCPGHFGTKGLELIGQVAGKALGDSRA